MKIVKHYNHCAHVKKKKADSLRNSEIFLSRAALVTDLDAAVVEAAVDPLLVRLDAQHEAVAEQALGLKMRTVTSCCYNTLPTLGSLCLHTSFSRNILASIFL